MDVRRLFARAVRLYGDRVAYRSGTDERTFRELWERGRRLARWWAELGIEPGDRVALLEGNTLGGIDSVLASTIMGVTRVPLYPGDITGQLRVLDEAACAGLVLDDDFADQAERIGDVRPGFPVLLRGPGYDHRIESGEAFDLSLTPPPVDEEALHIIRQTGGTTGTPKLTPYSHRRWIAACRDWFFALPQVLPEDRYLLASPLAHGGAYFFTTAWLSGASTVVPSAGDVESLLAAARQHRATFTFVVPPVARDLAAAALASGAELDLRVLAIAGGPVTSTLVGELIDAFGPVVWHAYGLSEAVPVTMMNARELARYHVAGDARVTSAGRPLAFADIRIAGPDGRASGENEIGEVQVHVDSQIPGYMCRGDVEAFAGRWIATGDAGWLDRDGFLHVVDRLRESTIVGSRRVWAGQIEEALSSRLRTSEVAVVALRENGPADAVAYRGRPDPGSDGRLRVPVSFPDGAVVHVDVHVSTTAEPLPRTVVGKVRRSAAGHHRP